MSKRQPRKSILRATASGWKTPLREAGCLREHAPWSSTSPRPVDGVAQSLENRRLAMSVQNIPKVSKSVPYTPLHSLQCPTVFYKVPEVESSISRLKRLPCTTPLITRPQPTAPSASWGLEPARPGSQGTSHFGVGQGVENKRLAKSV